ncbi:MAG: hypothetical protein ACI4BD_03720 [Paludibacteraceae bacterium]
MAKTDLEVPFGGMRGRLDRESDIYFTNRYGETVISHYPRHKDPKKISDRQKARHAVFHNAVAEADRQLKDPQAAAEWQRRFEEQKRTAKKPYRLLRNFVIATITKQQDSPKQ